MRFFIATAAVLLASCAPTVLPGPERSCETVLHAAAPQGSSDSLDVRGEWNAFNPQPMRKGPGGTFVWRGTLEPRDYAYGFGASTVDPLALFSRWVGDEEWSRLRVPDCAPPNLLLTSLTPRADGSLAATALVQRGLKGAAVTPTATLDGPAGPAAADVSFDVASGELRLEASGLSRGRHVLRLFAQDGAGLTSQPVSAPFWVEPEPFDWSDAVVYFVFVDRFRNGEPGNDAPVPGVPAKANFQGGDLQGVRAAIEDGYFERLGVNTLWLSPLEPSPDTGFGGNDGRTYSGYHGYWPVAARDVQRRFGGRAALDQVVAAAHARGMRVLGDAVVNHVHEEHPRYQQHKNDGWFRGGCLCTTGSCSFDVRPLDCWFAPYLPDVNWRNNAAAAEFEADARFWLDEVGFDGFRVDAVKHFELSGARALSGTAQELWPFGAGSYLVGEVFSGESQRPLLNQWLDPPVLDGQFDFPLYWRVVDVFARGQGLDRLDAAVAQSEAAYPSGARMSPFLGNHDVPRFLSIAAGQVEPDALAQAWSASAPPDVVTDAAAFARLQHAFTFLLTARGVPLVYYGDEIGLSGAGDPDNRRPMKWGALTALEASLRQHVETLGAARKKSLALRRGLRATLLAEAELWVQQRAGEGDDGALIVIHRGAAARTISLEPKDPLRQARARYRDIFSGVELDFGGTAATALTVPAGASMVFLRQP